MPLPNTDEALVGAILGEEAQGGPETPVESPEQAGGPSEEVSTAKAEAPDNEEIDEELQAALEAEQEEESEPQDQGAALDEETLTRVADLLGLDTGELSTEDGKLRIKTKIDGEVGEVTLSDLRKGYQKDASLTRKQMKFAEERKGWEEAQQQRQQEIQQQAQILSAVVAEDYKALQDAVQKADLNKLRDTDPAEYAAQVADFQRQDQALREKFQRANQVIAQQQQEQAKKFEEHRSSVVAAEHQKLREALKWENTEAATTGGAQIQQYLLGEAGYSEQDLAQFVDHRAAVIADKARRYDALMKRVGKAKAKVQKAPNPVRAPGGSTRVGAKPNLSVLKARAQKAGDIGSPESLAYLLAASSKKSR